MPVAPPFLNRDLRPWTWAATITVVCAALMTCYVLWSFGAARFGPSEGLRGTHLACLALPVLAHLALAARWHVARRVNLVLALVGVISALGPGYPTGLGVPAMLGAIPDWRAITAAATPPPPPLADPLPVTRLSLLD